MHVHVHGAGSPTRVLKVSLAVTLAYILLLLIAGIRAHSLALLAEAGHNLSDFLALLLSLVAVYFQTRPANPTKTYGYQRAGVLAALVNASSLVLVSFFIFYEAFQRLQHPEQVRASLMMWVAGAGVLPRAGGTAGARWPGPGAAPPHPAPPCEPHPTNPCPPPFTKKEVVHTARRRTRSRDS